MSFSFNPDGSLKANPKKKREHLPLLLALEELPFGMGTKLLLDHLRGRQTSRTIKLKLDKYMTFGDLGGYEEEELKRLINYLEINNYITHKKEKGIYQVYCLTTKGSEELQTPQLELDVSNLEAEVNKSLALENPFPESTPITEQEEQLFSALNDFFPQFNKRQKQAVINSNKRILCVAGAGSGKTSVLTKRINFLVTYKSTDTNKLLAITFTRKAREEMQTRLAKMLPNTNIQIETFNSFCEKTLQQQGRKIYTKPVRMASFKEQFQLLIDVLKQHGYSQSSIIQSYFTKRQQQGKEPKTLFFSFSYDFHSLLDKLRLTDSTIDTLRQSIQPNKEHASLAHTLLDMAETYLAEMRKEGLRDFTDQLIDAIELFKKHPDIIPNYEHILVDEFQDVNDQQINLLQLLNPKNLFAVGDPRQSIYGWRGSRISHILDFAKEEEATIIQLTKNYRSTNKIVNLCNEVIKTTGYEHLEAHKEEEGTLTITYHNSEDKQAQTITKEIKEYQGNKKDIFVLARTNKALDKIKNYFDTHQIRYLLRTDELKRPGIEAQSEQVTLATVHAIKGLEAKKVYLINANNTNFPCKASDHPVMDLYNLQADYDSYAEELRVLYVALSRPQQELHIHYTGSLSTFFNESATKLIKKKQTQKALAIKPSRDQTALMMKLRQWRYQKAKENGKPAYTICTDATLEAIIQQNPRYEDDLYAIPGLGPSKVQAFGDEILAILMRT